MKGKFTGEKVVWAFERATIAALQVLIMLAIFVATVLLYVLFAQRFYSRVRQIESVTSLLPAMQTIFAGVLIVLLGLELAETMKSYFASHQIRVEVILIVAIVAVGRHMIQLDFDHAPAAEVFGLSALILSLTAGYFLVKKAQTASLTAPDAPEILRSKPSLEYKESSIADDRQLHRG
jgi:uncharacterized membrane protein (DUF373 family)